MSKIIICGDFAPTSSNQESISKKHPKEIIGKELLQIFKSSDLVVINLETSLAIKRTPKFKRGQINTTIPEITCFFNKANISLCCLANNHSIDNGNYGLDTTLKTLRDKDVNFIGAGKNLDEAKKPFCINDKNQKIKIINISNYEFNKIDSENYGVYIYDPLETFDYIKEQSNNNEYVIIIFHSGIEYYQYPSPQLQRICRKMIDSGASLVTCQHSHCVGTYEEYNSGTIVYGQGNFLFDDSDKQLEKDGILLEIDTQDRSVGFIPIKKHESLVRKATNEEAVLIEKNIQERNLEIIDEEILKKKFSEFCDKEKISILNAFTGNNFVYKAINKLTGRRFQEYIYNSVNKMRIYNMITSISILEVVEEVLSTYNKEIRRD